MLGFLIVCFLTTLIPILLLIFNKWICAGISILAGDKEALNGCNLCESDNILFEQDPEWDYTKYRRYNRYRDDWRNKGEGNM